MNCGQALPLPQQVMELLSVDTRLLWAGLARLDAKAEQGLDQGRRLLSGQSVVRRKLAKIEELEEERKLERKLEMEDLRLDFLPAVWPKHLRRDWVAVFGKAAIIGLDEFILGGKLHVKSEAWSELMAALSDRCGMAWVFTHGIFCALLVVHHTLDAISGHRQAN